VWYGCPASIVNARYSCSASTSRASSWGRVMGPRDSTVCACRAARSDQPFAGPMAKTIACWPESRRTPSHLANCSEERASPRLSSSTSHAAVRARWRATKSNSVSSVRKATASTAAKGVMRSRYSLMAGPSRSLRVRWATKARVRFSGAPSEV
jgi:hypothetical protein